MSESLDRRLLRLKRRIRQVVWLDGASWLIAVLLGSAVTVGLVDWAFHLDDSGVRLILGLSILAAAGWIAWRRLVRPLRYQPGDVDLAMRIEQRYPGFNDSLSSTVEFLQKGMDPAVGSPELQRSVVARTTAQADRLNLSDIIDTRSVQRLVAIAVTVCLTSALVVGFNPLNAGIALNRLVFPFSGVAWPRTTDLRLLDADFQPLKYDAQTPLRLARGDVLTVYVENARGDLPADVRMEYRYSDDEVQYDRLRIATRRDAGGKPRELGVATLVATRGPVWFRAVGGDDRDQPPLELEVVPPPLIEDLEVTLTPPQYSGRPVEKLAQGVGHVEGLVGTEVSITGSVNKTLASAAVRLRADKPRPMELADGGRRFSTSFIIGEPGVYSYWFDLEDSQGFENPEAPRYEIRAIADNPPEVQIEVPAVDQYVTAAADVPLKILVRDDLGINDVRLHYKFGNTQDESIEPWLLRDGPADDAQPLELTVEQTWPLSGMMLSPGMRIVFYAAATDEYDLGVEHVGRSISRTLTVVTVDEKKAELASRQSELLDELERLVKAQRQAREQVGELETQLNTVGSLRPRDVDLLKRIELDQRQISSRLLNPVDGFEQRTLNSLDELKRNKIDAPEMESRLQQIAGEMAALKQNLLPAVEQELTRARKAANAAIGNRAENETAEEPAAGEKPQTSPDSAAEAEEEAQPLKRPDGDDVEFESAALSRARENQDAVLESLTVMKRQLTQWRNRHDLLQDVDDLIADQQRVREEAAEIGRRTLGRSGLERLTPQEEADLVKVADRQRRQAERLEQFRETLKSQSDSGDADPLSDSGTLQDARQHIKDSAIDGKMKQAADALRENRVGIAATSQQEIAENLDELRSILSDSGASDAETMVKKLKQAEDELLQLRKRQEELLKKTEEAERNSDSGQREQQLQQLQKEQQQVREEIARLSRQLRRLQANRPSESAARAAGRLRSSEDGLGENNPEGAAREQQEALDDLEQAQRELAQSRREAEERLARELMEKMADKLKLMIVMEQAVIDETGRLEEARIQRGSWSRGQLSSLKQLRETQAHLRNDTESLMESMSAVEVFVLALEGAARDMQRAIDRLAARQTDAATVAAETAAKERFEELVAVLKPESGSSPAAPGNGTGGEQAPAADDVIPRIAELKMLKSLQQSLLRRTAEIDAAKRDGGGLNEEQQRELESIASDQGRLADLARNLVLEIRNAIELDGSETGPSDGNNQEQ